MKLTTAMLTIALIFASTEVSPAGETEGTVGDTGFGSFQLIDAAGTTRLFNVAKGTTRFEPSDWRPATGDKIKLTFTEITKNNRKVLRPELATLVTAGPATVTITSPVEVEIVEVGKSGIKARLATDAKIVKFSTHRGTQMVPAGWLPAVGEKARIEFTAKEAAFTFGVGYVAGKIEKIEAGKPAPAEKKPENPE